MSSGTGSFRAAANFIAQSHGRITDKLAWLNPWLLDVNEWMLLHEICYPFESSPLDDATDAKLVALNGWFKAHPMHARWTIQLAAGDDVNWAHDVRIKASQYQWLSTQDQDYIAAQRIVDRRHSKQNMWRDLASAWSLGAIAAAALGWLLFGLGAIGYFVGRRWGNGVSACAPVDRFLAGSGNHIRRYDRNVCCVRPGAGISAPPGKLQLVRSRREYRRFDTGACTVRCVVRADNFGRSPAGATSTIVGLSPCAGCWRW